MKSSISFLFNSWSESSHNSTSFVFSVCCTWSSQIQRQYQKCHFQVLLAEPNIFTCHDASEVYVYSCFITVVERLVSRSCRLSSRVLPSDDVDTPRECAYLFLLRQPHALCVDCSLVPLDLVIWSKLPSLVWTKDPLC
jgi:hypothetical protein